MAEQRRWLQAKELQRVEEKTDPPKLRRATSVVSPWTRSMEVLRARRHWLYAPDGSRLAPDNVAEPVKGVPVSETSGIGKASEVLHSARPSGIARGAHRHRAHIMHLPLSICTICRTSFASRRYAEPP